MFQPSRAIRGVLPVWLYREPWPRSWSEITPENRRRLIGVTLTVVLEAGIIALLLTLGQSRAGQKDALESLVSFAASPDEAKAPDPTPEQTVEEEEAKPAALTPPVFAEAPPTPPESPPVVPLPPAQAAIPLSQEQAAAAEVPSKPAKPRAVIKGPQGPPNSGTPGDSQRVGGSGPNGEPLYAAAWYREPYPDELSGYLSTASGPGWGLINCRTVPDFRVDDCVIEGEFPRGSGIGRAVLAASWQFRVRPPRVGGRSKVGEWVRIRIDYDLRRN